MATFYVVLRGYVNLYTKVEAETEDKAYEKINISDLKKEDIFIYSDDFDFEKHDYVATEDDFKNSNIIDSFLSNAIIDNLINQEEAKKIRRKEHSKNLIKQQIKDAETNLVNATKAISEQIEKLKLELENLNN